MTTTATPLVTVCSRRSPGGFRLRPGRAIFWRGSGGDEFALLCFDLDQHTTYVIAQRIMATLDSDIRVGGQSHKASASIGVALIPQDGSTADEIIHHADLAMYRPSAKTRRLPRSSSRRPRTTDHPRVSWLRSAKDASQPKTCSVMVWNQLLA
jgi:predicted signal transduction protein with EAL and GGDEF domain